jgi:hypothetical protein
MHATIRRYRGVGAVAGQLAPRVSQGFVPILRQYQGFVAYCAFGGQDGDIYSIGLFETKQAGEAANARAREWVQANLRDLGPDPPEVIQGEVLNQALAPMRGGAQDQVFVGLSLYTGLRASAEDIRRRADQDFMPSIRSQGGSEASSTLPTSGTPAAALRPPSGKAERPRWPGARPSRRRSGRS